MYDRYLPETLRKDSPMTSGTTDLKTLLKDPSLLETRAYVAGEWMDAPDGATFDVMNPARGDVIAKVADMGRAQVSRAIDAAEAAMKDWAARPAKERAQVMRKWYDLMMQNQDDLGTIMTAEQGKPLAEAKGEVAYGASFIEWFGEEAKRVYGETIPGHQADKRLTVIRQPIGVVGSITPWNFPNAMIARKAGPALAVGCGFVARPARETPLSALAMAVLGERAGLPKGILSVVTSSKSSDVGKEFCENPKVRKLTFTGSTEVGRILLRQAADQVMKCSMELGGNAPFIVFDDADLDAAVDGVIAAKFRNGGETCVCANRIFVQDGVHDDFVERLSAKVAAMKVGPGTDADTQIGPMINMAALDKIRDHITDATAKGASIAAQATAPDGQYARPTVLTGATTDMRLASEETFGPVAPIFRFTAEAEAVDAANATPFGLAAYFYTADLKRAFRVGEALEFGMVGLNTGALSMAVSPFGGVKQSGLGREGARAGIEEYLETKAFHMAGI